MSTPRILHVEHHPQDVALVEQHLRAELPSFERQHVEIRADFLNALQTFAPDVIIASYQLPQFDGLALLSDVATHAPNIPVIIFAQANDVATAVACMKAGAADYITKDNVRGLKTAVQQALQKKTQHDHQLQIEQAAQARAESIQKLHNLAQIGAYWFDIRTGKWDSTPLFDQIFGIDDTYPKDIDGWSRLVHPAYESKIREQLTRFILEGDQSYDKEYPIVRPSDGEERWIHTERELEYNARGRAIQMRGTVQDITRRKLMEKAISESEFFLHKSQSVARIGSYSLDIKTGLFTTSQTLDEILGINVGYPKDLAGWTALIRPDHRVQMLRYMTQHVIIEHNRFDYEYPGIRPSDKEERWYHGLGEVELDENGRTIRLVGTVQDITERHRAEEALQLTRYSVDNVADAVYWINKDAQFIDVNETACHILGYTREEMLTMSVGDIDPNFAADQWVPNWEITKNSSRRMLVTRHQTKNGELIPVEVIAQILEFNGQELNCAVVRNISERQAAEARLRESEERLQRFSDVTKEGILFHHNGIIQDVNDAMAQMFGYKPEETLGRSLLDFVPPEEHTSLLPKIIQKEDQPYESLGLRKDGTTFSVEVIARTFEFQGKQLRVVCMRDITERKQIESALQQSEERLKQAVEVGNIGTFDHDHLTDVIYYSPQLRNMWGLDPVETITIPKLVKHMHPEDQERIDQAIREAHSPLGDGKYEVEQRVVLPDKSISWQSVRARTFFAGEGEARRPIRTVGAVIDVTDVRTAEKAREKLEEQLRQAQKLEGLGRLAGGIAHDFNNLLVPMIGYTELGQMRVPTDSKAYTYFEKIGKAATRAADLTKQILAFSRRQMLEIGLFDLNDVVLGFRDMLQRLIGEDIHMQIFPAPSPCIISADRTQIEQVLMNLVINARDAMPDGGQLIIETDTVFLDESYAQTHPDTEPGHYTMLSISDTGHGMDGETQQHIFDPFFTTKEWGKGTGLGLATVFGIVKQHRGNIWVYSEPDEGTTFKIYLPRPVDTALVNATLVPEMPTVYGTETVLVVEDEPMVRKLACETLATYGYAVLEALSPQNGLQIAATYEGKIHLLLTDVIMPEMNGRELHNKMVEIRPDIKVLFMSGYTDNVIVHHGVLDEGVNFLEKPFTIRHFSQKIRRVLDE